MRIGIITILKVDNYGAELQAYALQKKLEILGYESEIIDYLYYKHPDYIYTEKAHPLFDIGKFNALREAVFPVYKKIMGGICRKNSARAKLFNDFHKHHTRMSYKAYHSLDELYEERMPYDIYMVGSDQVWNPRTNVSLEPYFLTFAPKENKKISYASSFGVSTIPEKSKLIYANLLNNIDHLSVRETQGLEIIRKLTGREASHVLDPTFLLTVEEWYSIAKEPNISKPYILLYDVVKSRYIIQFALHLANRSGLPVIRISGSPSFKIDGIEEIYDAGPNEFLGLLRQADYVITNSFHGAAFSINFRKPFYTVVPKRKNNSSRLHGLLEMMALENKLLIEGEKFPSLDSFYVDHARTIKCLELYRDNSIGFIQNSIKS